jgi:hypothetical protein
VTARARTTDPSTSHAAAASVSNTAAVRGAVLAILDLFGPMTDDELVRNYETNSLRIPGPVAPRSSASGLRTRRAELRNAGYVHDTGGRERLASGRAAIVWGTGFVCPGCKTLHPLSAAARVDDEGGTFCHPCTA